MKLFKQTSSTTSLSGFSLAAAALVAALSSPVSSAPLEFYRYTNEQGVLVINSAIPPEFVSKGYEVVTLGGEVIRTVEPSISPEEAARLREKKLFEREQEAIKKELLKRYSTVDDIEAAKQRKLASVEGYMAILRGNLHSIATQIEQKHADAANTERAGRTVSEAMLKTIEALKLDQERTREQLAQRQQEIQTITDRFEEEKRRFERFRPSKGTESAKADS